MLLLRTTAWIICLAEMVFLITYIKADSFITTAQGMNLQNFNTSVQHHERGNITTNTSLRTKDKLTTNSKLISSNTTSQNCNKDQNLDTKNLNVSDLKTLIESHINNINEKNITLTQTYQEFQKVASGFFNDPDTTIADKAIDLGNEYLGNTADFLISIIKYDSLVHTYKCMNRGKDLDFHELTDKEIQNQIKHNQHIIREFEYLFNLTLLRTEIYYKNEESSNSVAEYNSKRDLSYLEKSIKENEEKETLIYEYIPYLKEYHAFMENEQLHENFRNEFTEHIIDNEFWKEYAVNTTNDLKRDKKYLFEERHRILIQEKIQPAAQSVIFIIGFVGNLILLIIFARHKEIRNPPNMMVLNLAIGDAFNLIINIPTFYMYYMSSTWGLGEEVCKAFRFFRQLGIAVSIYSVVMISIQRFVALSQLYRGDRSTFKMSTRLMSTIIILSVWLIATLLAIPHTIHAGVYNGNCYGASENHEYYSTFITLFDFILFCSIPVILIITLSLSVAYLIKRSVKNMPGESMGMDNLIKTRIISSNVLIGLTFVSAISYVPLYLFMLIYAWSDMQIETSKYIVLFFVLYTLSFANCCFNPIALYIFSGRFRKYFNIYLLCRKLTEEDESSKHTSTGTNISTLDTKM